MRMKDVVITGWFVDFESGVGAARKLCVVFANPADETFLSRHRACVYRDHWVFLSRVSHQCPPYHERYRDLVFRDVQPLRDGDCCVSGSDLAIMTNANQNCVPRIDVASLFVYGKLS